MSTFKKVMSMIMACILSMVIGIPIGVYVERNYLNPHSTNESTVGKTAISLIDPNLVNVEKETGTSSEVSEQAEQNGQTEKSAEQLVKEAVGESDYEVYKESTDTLHKMECDYIKATDTETEAIILVKNTADNYNEFMTKIRIEVVPNIDTTAEYPAICSKCHSKEEIDSILDKIVTDEMRNLGVEPGAIELSTIDRKAIEGYLVRETLLDNVNRDDTCGVVNIIFNRMFSTEFPDTAYEVLTMPGQFAYTSEFMVKLEDKEGMTFEKADSAIDYVVEYNWLFNKEHTCYMEDTTGLIFW